MTSHVPNECPATLPRDDCNSIRSSPIATTETFKFGSRVAGMLMAAKEHLMTSLWAEWRGIQP